MNALKFLIGFLRLGPLPLLLVAAVILGGGFYWEIQEQKRDAARDAAIAAGPPATVDIRAFDPARDVTALDEVQIRAQLDVAMDYQLTIERDGTDDLAYMVPLVAVDAIPASQVPDRNPAEPMMLAEGPDWPEIVGVAIYTGRDFSFEDVDGMLLARQAKEFGPYGPILTLNGEHRGLGLWDEIVRDSFAEQNRPFPRDAIVVFPYLNGRAAALAPREADQLSLFDITKYVAAAIAALALLKLAVHRESEGAEDPSTEAPWEDAKAAEIPEEPEPGFDFVAEIDTTPAVEASLEVDSPAPAPAAVESHPHSTRSMAEATDAADPQVAVGALFAEMESDPDFSRPEFDPGFDRKSSLRTRAADPVFETPDEPEPVRERMADRFRRPPAAEAEEPLPAPRRSGIPVVRKLLIGVVLLAFLTILGGTLMSLFDQSAESDVAAAVLTPQEEVARDIAQRFVPETPPDQRAWYEINIAPMVQWVVAKALLALAGDTGAIIWMMALIGTPILLLIMLRWWFFARSVLTPRVSRGISDMGLE